MNERPAGLPTIHGSSEVVNLGGQVIKHFQIVVGISSIITCVSAYMRSYRAVTRLSPLGRAIPDPRLNYQS